LAAHPPSNDCNKGSPIVTRSIPASLRTQPSSQQSNLIVADTFQSNLIVADAQSNLIVADAAGESFQLV